MSDMHIFFTALLAIFASARLTRLVVADTYPPVIAFRNWWRKVTKDGEWAKLVDCPWCASPYISAAVVASGYFSDWSKWWYLAMMIPALAWWAAWVTFHDED